MAARRKGAQFKIDRADVLRVAAAAGVDPRTVDRVANGGGSPRSIVVARAVADALEAEGFGDVARAVRARCSR